MRGVVVVVLSLVSAASEGEVFAGELAQSEQCQQKLKHLVLLNNALSMD